LLECESDRKESDQGCESDSPRLPTKLGLLVELALDVESAPFVSSPVPSEPALGSPRDRVFEVEPA